jgi:hypothetical protein
MIDTLTPSSPNLFLPFLKTEKVRALIFGLWGFSSDLAAISGAIDSIHTGYVGAANFVIRANLSGRLTEIICSQFTCQHITAIEVILCCTLTVLRLSGRGCESAADA